MLRVGHREEDIAGVSASEMNREIAPEYIPIEGRRQMEERGHIHKIVDRVHLLT
jgi:hypothetical protein